MVRYVGITKLVKPQGDPFAASTSLRQNGRSLFLISTTEDADPFHITFKANPLPLSSAATASEQEACTTHNQSGSRSPPDPQFRVPRLVGLRRTESSAGTTTGPKREIGFAH